MNWDYLLDEPEFDDEKYDYVLDCEDDYDYDDPIELLDELGDWGSDEYDRIISQNY